MPSSLPSLVLRLAAFCLAAATFATPIHAGTVRTIGGETFEGDARLDNGAVTITVKGQPAQRVELTNVLRAEFVAKKPEPAIEGLGPGVQLRNGAVIGGKVIGIDGTAVHVQIAGQSQDFPLANVARVMFATLPEPVARTIPAGFTGAVLPGGDMYEGEYRGMEDKPPAVKINSPILGIHRFGLRSNELIAVVLRDVLPPTTPDFYRIQTLDGSAYGVASLQQSGDAVMLHDAMAGDIKIPGKQITTIYAGPARVLPLGPLRPQGMASVLPAKVPAAYTADALPTGGAITLTEHAYDGGIAQAAGVSIAYLVPQGFSVFVAQAGLPEGAAPGVSVTFVLLVDGRPVWRSQPVAAGAAPVPVRWNLGTSARTLTLYVEAGQPAALGTVAAWADATLLKP